MANKLASPFTVLSSAARTTGATSASFRLPPGARGLAITLNATAITSTPSVTMQLQDYRGANAGGTIWGTVLTSAAATAGTTLTTIIVHPNVPVAANYSATTAIKDVFRVVTVAGDSDSMTYSVVGFPLA